MKKVFSALIALLIAFGACAFAEPATSGEPLEEGQMYFHGYRNTLTGYYIGVPAEWTLVGLDSTSDNLKQAYEVMGRTEVTELLAQLNENNDILFCVGGEGEQLALTYGLSDGVISDELIDQLDSFKAILSASYTGIEFKEDSGAYAINEFSEILYIGAKYKGHDISQYFIPMGAQVFVFTFTDVESDIENAVLGTFHIPS